MAFKLGMDCKLYRDTGSAWDLVPNVKNLSLNMDKSEADVTTRANGGWKASVAALKDASVEFNMVYDNTDADLTAIRNAYLNNTVVRFIILDGLIDVAAAGSQGLQASFMVTKCTMPQNIEEAVMCDVTLKVAYAAVAPAWVSSPIVWA